MNFFARLLGKKTIEQIITETKANLYKTYGIQNPSNALEFKSILILSLASMGMLSSIANGGANEVLDEIALAARSMTKGLMFKMNEVGLQPDELEEVFSFMPSDMSGDEDINVNGLVLCPTIFNLRGPDIVREISQSAENDFGIFGSAAIYVGQEILGEGNDGRFYIQTMNEMHSFLEKIVKTKFGK